MASGKQLSFAFGEVSPALRFRSDASFYSQALSKLHNGYVRKSGGVSNRSGTLHFCDPTNQEDISEKETSLGVRLFPFTGSVNQYYLIELKRSINKISGVWECPIKSIDSIGVERIAVWTTTPGTYFTGSVVTLSLEKASIVQLNDSAIITVPGTDGTNYIFVLGYDNSLGNLFGVKMELTTPEKIGTALPVGTATAFGLEPLNIPVSYLITQELTDGSEVQWQQVNYAEGHPHSQLSLTFTIDASPGNGIKQYNIYRADGPGGSYALVGRVPPSSNASTFRDYLVAPDITVQPPLDLYLYSVAKYIRKITFYKERALLIYAAYDPGGTNTFKYVEGQIGASKLGSVKMFGRPLTPNLIDAFSFTIPLDKIRKITNALVLNRLIVFTDKNAFTIRGGAGGVLTPQEVNPETIHHEGCSDEINPVVSGNTGFFIPPDRSKLLGVQYTRDDSVVVADVSIQSDHLFEGKDIIQMEIVTGVENMVWMLKKDGTLICLTTSLEGSIQGFSTHKTDGFIESICAQNSDPRIIETDLDINANFPPMLFMSVIRKGVRYYEKLVSRNDINPVRYLFADCATPFGSVPIPYQIFTPPFLLNVTTSTDYLAGSPLTLTNVGPVSPAFSPGTVGKKVDLFYNIYDADGRVIGKSKQRLTVDAYVSGNVVTASCMEDLNILLQDIQGSALSANEKKSRQLQFTFTTRYLTGLNHLAGREVSVFADGSVISSPLEPTKYDVLTVANDGTLDLLDDYDYGYVGLPYTTEVETLNLEASDARTFTDVGKLINKVGVGVRRTAGTYVGQSGQTDLLNMEQMETRKDMSIENANEPFDGYVTVPFPSEWEQTGRVLFKQVSPLPMSILSVYPKGVIGD